MSARPGWVYLVGAGPGDPGLITVRGLELLRSCDVVVYDRLVASVLLDEAPPEAERVFAGKKPGESHSRQVISDALLVERAKAGKSVVRLKGGDPFVFGRGGEEAALLAEARIPFEVVPGVTSVVAGPGYAGIPVTHRGVAPSFTVLTAQEGGDGGSPVRWKELAAGSDTLVLVMGVKTLAHWTKHLVDAGRDPAEPAAMIERATTPRQRTITSTLGSIAADAAAAGISPPALAIVGPVVALRDTVAWFERRPLFGRRVVVTRPARRPGGSAGLAGRLEELGADVIECPVIGVVAPESWDELDAAVRAVAGGNYEWVLFASKNSVESFFDRLAEAGLDARALARAKLGAVGTATARSLRERGLVADLVPKRFTGEDLAAALGPGSGRVLLPRAAGAPQDIVTALAAADWRADDVPAYRTVSVRPEGSAADAVKAGEFDAITFTSASAVTSFVESLGAPESLGLSVSLDQDDPHARSAAAERDDPGAPVTAPRLVVCIGPITAQAAVDAGFRVDAVAGEHTNDGLIEILISKIGS